MREFLSRWGNKVSFRVHPNGTVQVLGIQGGPASPEAEQEFPGFVPWIKEKYCSEVRVQSAQDWSWQGDLLRARALVGGRPTALEKFSWSPKTGETWLMQPGQAHSSVRTKLSEPFDDYVRGIVLIDQNLIALRPVVPSWTPGYPLVPRATANIVSMEMQDACKQALEAFGSSGWGWQFNINNALLEELTGYHRW
jgi:hypothetical protein